MDDAARVRGGNSLGDLQRVGDGAARRQRAAVQPGAQRLAVHELGDDERRAAVLRELEDREDVGWESFATLIASRSNRASASASARGAPRGP